MFNKYDTVRLKKTDIIGTVLEVNGHHVTIKCDTISLAPQVLLEEELELFGLQNGDAVKLKGTEFIGTVMSKYSDHHYRVQFPCYSNSINTFRDSEIERVIK